MEESNHNSGRDRSYEQLLKKSKAILKKSRKLQDEAVSQSRRIYRLLEQSEEIISHSRQLAEKTSKLDTESTE